MSHSELVMFI